jgi:F-type H+-transporting ATPase subunit epsilon
MNLKILLPFQIFADLHDVSNVVAETTAGSFGFLPHRLDCVAALVPGILYYQSTAKGEVYLGVDEGVLVKTGQDLLISVRNALAGTDLGQLREAVDKDFLRLDAQEKQLRASAAKMEGQLAHQLLIFENE